MKQLFNLNKTALFIALLFHICGLLGILFTPYKDWFIKNTPLNLLLMAALLIATHSAKNKRFFYFLIITVITGFAVEVIGVNTAFLFGNYNYGPTLGFQLLNVPVLIGVNWFIIIYCVAMFTQAYENFMLRKLDEQGLTMNKKLRFTSFIADAVFLAVLFDWIIEPVAVKLGYWQWQTTSIPYYNYISWMFVSAVLLWVFKKLNTGTHNIFAIHLFMIQVLFFLLLRTFL